MKETHTLRKFMSELWLFARAVGLVITLFTEHSCTAAKVTFHSLEFPFSRFLLSFCLRPISPVLVCGLAPSLD
jgi:hypothetical protein